MSRYSRSSLVDNDKTGRQIIDAPSKNFIKSFLDGNEKTIEINAAFEYRPDKLAEYYLGNPQYDWILTLLNNFDKGIEDYYLGRLVIIPTRTRVSDIMEQIWYIKLK